MLKRLFSGAIGLFAMRLAGAGAGFLTQILLARTMGTHDLGVFYAATSLATVAGFVTSQGYSQIVYRFAARYRDESRASLLRAFIAQATFDGLFASTIAALAVLVTVQFLPGLSPSEKVVFAIAAATIIPSAMTVFYSNLAGAIRMFSWCYVPDGLARPLLFIAVIGVSSLWLGALSPPLVMIVFSVLFTAVPVAIFFAVRSHVPPFNPLNRAPARLAARWRAEARPLVLLSLYTNSFADVSILLVTPFLSMSEIAVFGVALKLSLLIGYFVQIGQQVAIPDLADARQQRNPVALFKATRRALIIPALFTVASLAGCAVLGEEVLGIFGREFSSGYLALLILVFSQVLRAFAGPSAHMLMLSGSQLLNAALCVGALIVLFVLNAVLAPKFGAVGAALAVLISYAIWLLSTAVSLSWLGETRTDITTLFFSRRTEPKLTPAPEAA